MRRLQALRGTACKQKAERWGAPIDALDRLRPRLARIASPRREFWQHELMTGRGPGTVPSTSSGGNGLPRFIKMNEVLRYAKGAPLDAPTVGGYPNFHFRTVGLDATR